ncbi:MAG: LPXTG cell wall anchor domain-containing protein, partial [Clostridia bacterium]|nr:LPXTG cell wall anchor domain-containing protein [Clostridia bacterium]
NQGGNQGGAAQTGSSVTVLAVVAVVALAATAVVISKRRIED